MPHTWQLLQKLLGRLHQQTLQEQKSGRSLLDQMVHGKVHAAMYALYADEQELDKGTNCTHAWSTYKKRGRVSGHLDSNLGFFIANIAMNNCSLQSSL